MVDAEIVDSVAQSASSGIDQDLGGHVGPRPNIYLGRDPSLGTSGGRGETVLLVEDDEQVRDVIKRILSRDGYTVIAVGPEDVFERTVDLHRKGDGRIDLLVTDVVMPVVSGGELASWIEEVCPDAAIVFVSGHDQETLAREGVAARANFVPKPFTAEQLLTAARSALDAR